MWLCCSVSILKPIHSQPTLPLLLYESQLSIEPLTPSTSTNQSSRHPPVKTPGCWAQVVMQSFFLFFFFRLCQKLSCEMSYVLSTWDPESTLQGRALTLTTGLSETREEERHAHWKETLAWLLYHRWWKVWSYEHKVTQTVMSIVKPGVTEWHLTKEKYHIKLWWPSTRDFTSSATNLPAKAVHCVSKHLALTVLHEQIKMTWCCPPLYRGHRQVIIQ